MLFEDGLAPSRLPELFSGRPVTIFGRFQGDASQLRLQVDATDAAGRLWSRTLAACPRPAASLLNLWGRVKVRELEDRYAAGGVDDPQALADQIVKVSLESRVLSRFTAYVAVDRSEVVNEGGQQKKILQPVEMPAGWEEPAALVACCMSAPPPSAGVRRATWACHSMPPSPGQSFLAKSRRSLSAASGLFGGSGASPTPPPPRTIADVAGEIRDLLAKKKDLGHLKSRTLAKHLATVVTLIEELAALLRQSSHPELTAVEQAVTDGRSYVAELTTSSPTAPDAAKLQEYFFDVVAILDAIENPPEEKPERKEFWL